MRRARRPAHDGLRPLVQRRLAAGPEQEGPGCSGAPVRGTECDRRDLAPVGRLRLAPGCDDRSELRIRLLAGLPDRGQGDESRRGHRRGGLAARPGPPGASRRHGGHHDELPVPERGHRVPRHDRAGGVPRRRGQRAAAQPVRRQDPGNVRGHAGVRGPDRVEPPGLARHRANPLVACTRRRHVEGDTRVPGRGQGAAPPCHAAPVHPPRRADHLLRRRARA